MEIEKIFDFLVKDYGFSYKYQEFCNCYGKGWDVYTYSFYNRNGCFTIHSLPQRGELDFYYAHTFSTIRRELYEKAIDIRSIEKETWKKYTKIGIFNNPFFWLNDSKVLNAFAKVLKLHIAKHGEFFGTLLRLILYHLQILFGMMM